MTVKYLSTKDIPKVNLVEKHLIESWGGRRSEYAAKALGVNPSWKIFMMSCSVDYILGGDTDECEVSLVEIRLPKHNMLVGMSAVGMEAIPVYGFVDFSGFEETENGVTNSG